MAADREEQTSEEPLSQACLCLLQQTQLGLVNKEIGTEQEDDDLCLLEISEQFLLVGSTSLQMMLGPDRKNASLLQWKEVSFLLVEQVGTSGRGDTHQRGWVRYDRTLH